VGVLFRLLRVEGFGDAFNFGAGFALEGAFAFALAAGLVAFLALLVGFSRSSSSGSGSSIFGIIASGTGPLWVSLRISSFF
jgi:hypothetical protein